jgi:hypothetical protein
MLSSETGHQSVVIFIFPDIQRIAWSAIVKYIDDPQLWKTSKWLEIFQYLVDLDASRENTYDLGLFKATNLVTWVIQFANPN